MPRARTNASKHENKRSTRVTPGTKTPTQSYRSKFGSSRRARASYALVSLLAAALLLAPAAHAAKQAVAHFESDGGDVAVNSTGAGPAQPGEIYVLGGFEKNRIERFAVDENGTPSDPYDDTYTFISAWGAGVQTGGSNYQVCTVQAECRLGLASAGNATVAGDGALNKPEGIAVDQDTGDLYVSDTYNNRVDVYTGDGIFLRSFGTDVVESGPDNAGTGYELCVAAAGDVCKAGLGGSWLRPINSQRGRPIAARPPPGAPHPRTLFLPARGSNHPGGPFCLDRSSPP